MLRLGLPENRQWDGCPFGLGLVTEDEPTEFSCMVAHTNRFQAADELERKEWMDVLTSAILTGLDTREQTLARVVKQTKSTEILQQIQENPSNKTCADCAATEPVWGVINLGIMVCINCSGVYI